MHPSWFQRVERYLDDVEAVAAQLDATLKNARLDTSEFNVPGVDSANATLLESLAALEQKIADRESLRRAEDAPEAGASLTEKLQRCPQAQGQNLAPRCQEVSQLISIINQRAISLFVCQFHLSQLSGDIIRLLAGQTAPPTYQAPNRGEKKGELGGGLFNEAA